MGNKQKNLKRRIEKPPEENDEGDSGQESVESEEELLNVVNGDDGDSSDSDREIESSDEEDLEESDDEAEESDNVDDDPEESEDVDEESHDDEDADEESHHDEDVDEESHDDEESEDVDGEMDDSEVDGEREVDKDDATSSKNEIVSKPAPPDEYADHDTSDEEDIRNTVGNIPKNWYDEYKHFGYDWDGNQIIKPETGDHLDNFLKRMEDPDFWRTVKDLQTGQNVVLSDEDIQLIRRIKANKIPDATFEEYAPWVEWFTSEVMKTPLRKFPEHKRSFLPSQSDAKKISKLVHALKMGWIKTRAEAEKLRAKKEPQFYMLWASDDQADEMRRIHKHIQAPKRLLPGHAESYNPPPEYLFDERELKQWNKHKNAPWKRKLHFVPQKYSSLRHVPAYPRYIKERFLRCLDLYLCPRGIKMKLNIEPESLVPKLPSPRDLQPFPTVLALEYKGHTDMVRTISTDKSGQYLASGSDDGTVKLWEVNTGRCLKTIQTDDVVRSVEWCPNAALSLILVATGNRVLLINPHLGDFVVCSKTDAVLETPPKSDAIVSERVRTTVEWSDSIEPDLYSKGVRIVLKHFKEVSQVTWHGKGDYFATVMPDGLNRSVLIGQVSRRRSQLPFTKPKGLVQCVLFHPTKPFLFVATQRHVRIYDLVKQVLTKKLLTNSKWISTMSVHPGGDNLLVGTYDRKMLWFDLDLSTKPYQTLRLHGAAVRGVAFHKRYPLFASGSDDKSLIVSHGMVYNDLLKNPLIVPLKRLQDHETTNDFGIFGVHFHPLQPWVFSSGAAARDLRRSRSKDRRSKSKDRRSRSKDKRSRSRDRKEKDRRNRRSRSRERKRSVSKKRSPSPVPIKPPFGRRPRSPLGLRSNSPVEELSPEERDARTVFVMQLSQRIRARDLEEFFSSVGKVRDVRLIVCNKTRRFKGIAYIEFKDPESVALALGLSGQKLLGVPIIVQHTQAEKNRMGNSMPNMMPKGMTGPMRLYVGSLHFNITEEMLRGIFEPFGKIDNIQLIMDPETGRSKGYGFIAFHNCEDAKKALEQLNGFELAGRPMKVGNVTERLDLQQQGPSILDSDELDRSGIDLGATGRLQLMFKLAEGAGMQVPQAAANALSIATGQPVVPQVQTNSTPPIATQCFMLSNMFDPATESNQNWDVEIRDDVIEECNKHGGVLHVYVDKGSPQGNVYVKCPSIATAVASVNSLHGRWFAGRVITAAYVPLLNYHSLFPDAMTAAQLLLPSNRK